jgi:hypothetical protein
VHRRLLEEALADFAVEASTRLQAEIAAGAEITFELEASAGGRAQIGRGRARQSGLQLYSPLTGRFIADRWPLLAQLQSCRRAMGELEAFHGLERYLASLELRGGLRTPIRSALATQALKGFLDEVFHQQSDFALREPRLRAALARVEAASLAEAGTVTLLASLRGLAILSPRLQLTDTLTIARPEALSGVPEQALAPLAAGAEPGDFVGANDAERLLVVLEVADEDGRVDRALHRADQLLRELLRALRLYGDGRIALSPLACACAGDGPFAPVALTCGGGRSEGVLVVRPEQEDELRAFCSLLARQTPGEDALAWALRRFELGCERGAELEALSDHLLALQALLEPDRLAPGLLAARTAALCSAPEARRQTAARVLAALELERELLRGEAERSAATVELAREVEGHVRALLRDVICGHLQPDLIALADELALAGEEPLVTGQQPPPRSQRRASETRTVRARRSRRTLAAEDTQLQDALPI